MTKQKIKEKIRRAVKNDPNKEYIKSISLFGSYLHGDHKKRSDIDLLIEFRKNLGLFRFVDIQLNFEKCLGNKVELVTKDSLSKYFRDEVLTEAELMYKKDILDKEF